MASTMAERGVPVEVPAEVVPEKTMWPSLFRRFSHWFDTPWFDVPATEWFDRMWAMTPSMIRVEEELTDDELVVRAEIPGIDPDHDVEITLADDVLRIKATRSKKEREEKEGHLRSEFSYGSFVRTLTIPKGITPEEVSASYKDGILEVRVPLPKQELPGAHRIAITKG